MEEKKKHERSRKLNKEIVESSKAYYILFNKWRRNDLYKSLFASFGLIIAIFQIEYDTKYYTGVIDTKTYPDALVNPRSTNWYGTFFKMLILMTTILSLIFSFLSRKYKIDWLREYFEIELPSAINVPFLHQDDEDIVEKRYNLKYPQKENDNKNKDDLNLKEGKQTKNNFWSISFVIEIMILLIIPYPGLNWYIIDGATTHLLSDILIALMFLRIYIIFTSYLLN